MLSFGINTAYLNRRLASVKPGETIESAVREYEGSIRFSLEAPANMGNKHGKTGKICA
jgi:hypothetical protein